MNRNWIILLAAVATSACQKADGSSVGAKDVATEDAAANDVVAKRAWAKCIFELDKIEATRGRNLDDLDKGGSVARNQFMMDCLNVEFGSVTMDQLDEMERYKSGRAKRSPSDMSLNNGKR